MARARRPVAGETTGPAGGQVDPFGPPLLEVRFDAPHRGLGLSELLRKEGGAAHLIACRLVNGSPRRLVRWLDLELAPERLEPFLRALRGRFGPHPMAFARLGPGRGLLQLAEPAPAICAAAQDAGGVCVTCPLLTTEDRESWRVVLPRGPRTRAFLRDLPAGSVARPAIARVGAYRSATTLTPHQDRLLRTAYDLGYFDYPRRASLGDVARALGAGRSATLEGLRRATAKLAGRRYGDELRVRVPPEAHRRPVRRGQ